MLTSLPDISLLDLCVSTCVAALLWLVWPRGAQAEDVQRDHALVEGDETED